MKICILTAGKGTRMGSFSNIVNKSLLPVNGKAIISHLIDTFPNESQFVIALGYLGEQVKNYLSLAHPDKNFIYVNVENFEGKGSGPGFSLLSCKNYLQEPFFYTPCDCLIIDDIPNVYDRNWLGIEKIPPSESVHYCNVLIEHDKVKDIRDKKESNSDYYAFTTPLFVHDFSNFWTALEQNQLINNEHQISNGIQTLMNSGLYAYETKWINLGDLEKYNAIKSNENPYDFSKPDELIYFINKKVIKFFNDQEILNKKIIKNQLKPNIFPKIKSFKNFFSYDFFNGDVFYTTGDPTSFVNLLSWLDDNLWINNNPESIFSICKEFYYDKTILRYNKFLKDFSNYPLPKKINGKQLCSFDILIKKIPWDILFDGKQSFIHGDLNFGNILYEPESKEFLLIDWRHDFAGVVEYGDIYYDLAKLWAGIQINFDLIRKGEFKIKFENDDCLIELPTWKYQKSYEEIFDNFLDEKSFDKHKVHLLGGLTFINMAPLHLPPFNYLLMAYGSSIIQNELNNFLTKY